MKTGHKWNHPKDHQAVPECKKCNQSLWNAATTVCKGDLVQLADKWRRYIVVDGDDLFLLGISEGLARCAGQLDELLNTEGGKQ